MSKPNKQLKLVINAGRITAIYDDALTAIMDGGDITIKRASHVEPWFGHKCEWMADMRPVNGPILSGFKTRQEALDAERLYLDKYVVA